MNRYLLFWGSCYYPRGGWDDFVSSYVEFQSALNRKAELASIRKPEKRGYNWFQVVDSTTREILESEQL